MKNISIYKLTLEDDSTAIFKSEGIFNTEDGKSEEDRKLVVSAILVEQYDEDAEGNRIVEPKVISVEDAQIV